MFYFFDIRIMDNLISPRHGNLLPPVPAILCIHILGEKSLIILATIPAPCKVMPSTADAALIELRHFLPLQEQDIALLNYRDPHHLIDLREHDNQHHSEHTNRHHPRYISLRQPP